MRVMKSTNGRKVNQQKLHVYLWNTRDKYNDTTTVSQKQLCHSLGVTRYHMSVIYRNMISKGWLKKIKGTRRFQVFDPKKFNNS